MSDIQDRREKVIAGQKFRYKEFPNSKVYNIGSPVLPKMYTLFQDGSQLNNHLVFFFDNYLHVVIIGVVCTSQDMYFSQLEFTL